MASIWEEGLMETTWEDVLRRLTTPTRNRYFYGKLLDVYHFELEQHYFNRKRWLLNRLSLGTGILCGLPVTLSNDATRILVGPGAAIDSLGREVIVPSPSAPLDPRQPTDAGGNPVGDPVSGAGTVTLCLAYHQCETEQVPVLVGDCDTERGCAASTICERYRLQIITGPAAAIQTSCGFPNIFQVVNGGLPNLQPQLSARSTQVCPEVSGPPCIALAQINLPAQGTPLTQANIDQSVRPVVPTNELLLELLVCLAEQGAASNPGLDPNLTKVTKISWAHDGSLPLAKFLKPGLTVTFSDNITSTTNTGRGWFLVDVEYPSGSKAPNTASPGTITRQRVLDQSIAIKNNQASFVPDPRFATTFRQTLETLQAKSALCRVRLECDFLQDSQKRVVDGDFLGGSLNSGDGVPGGVFESWFTLQP